MGATEQDRIVAIDFETWLADAEPRLRQALVSTYGPVDGREATVDALSWAWEHWDRVREMTSPLAFLYRVGQSATRRFATRSGAVPFDDSYSFEIPDSDPATFRALARLPRQQRVVVLLVHGFQWRQQEVAELLEISPSTVNAHLRRATKRLRTELNGHDH